MKKLISSSSLCEDVYKMRDKVDEMKKFYEMACKILKKMFEEHD